MQAQKKIGMLLLIVIVAVTETETIIHSQQKQGSASLKKTINDEYVPIANYNQSLPTDIKEKDERLKKSKRRNLELGAKTGVYDPTRFMLTEERHSSYGGFETHASVEPAIPVAKSDVVITGEITKAEAFLTEDKVSIYSEFAVKISSILKNSTSEDINVGDSIVISRGGGGVRFPSGKVIKKLFEGKPMPHVGSKHILFLKYEAAEKDYLLITGYEVRDNKIIPLDGLDRDGRIIYQLTSHQSYKGTSETDFLNLVQQVINTSKDLFEKKWEL